MGSFDSAGNDVLSAALEPGRSGTRTQPRGAAPLKAPQHGAFSFQH